MDVDTAENYGGKAAVRPRVRSQSVQYRLGFFVFRPLICVIFMVFRPPFLVLFRLYI